MSRLPPRVALLLASVAVLLLGLVACEAEEAENAGADEDADVADVDEGDEAGEEEPEALTVYSGRAEDLVGPALEDFTETTGIPVEVRYGETAEMAAQIIEEGDNSPADVFFGQDAGALGQLQADDRLVAIPSDITEQVDERFRSPDDLWTGISGRARVLIYNTEALSEDELPDSILDLTDEEWQGRVGWSPPNGSFQAQVTAMRVELGEDETAQWLEGMLANDAQQYENNTAIVEATGAGEVDLGITNHYYLYRFLEEDPDFAADNAYLEGGDIGSMVNIAGAGVLDTADDPDAAFELINWMLGEEAQTYFANETFEHPLVPGIEGDERVPGIEEVDVPEDLDLADLDDLEGTVGLLRETGALP